MNSIKISAKLYQCRDTAKSFLKEDYKKRLQPYIDHLKHVMKTENIEEIPALIKTSETDFYQSDGMVQLMFMAALVEIIEPS
jgi:hypothetical protein